MDPDDFVIDDIVDEYYSDTEGLYDPSFGTEGSFGTDESPVGYEED